MTEMDERKRRMIEAIRSGDSPYELARRWSDRLRWPIVGHGTDVEVLEELAVMSSLRTWLERWTPLMAHRAIMAGASVDEAAAAAGTDASGLADLWVPWAEMQRDLWATTGRGVSPAEFATVGAQFSRAGVFLVLRQESR